MSKHPIDVQNSITEDIYGGLWTLLEKKSAIGHKNKSRAFVLVCGTMYFIFVLMGTTCRNERTTGEIGLRKKKSFFCKKTRIEKK